ncbi:phosphatase PAP2 family protein [Klenkia soli]|uniref:phosphatase PAP2 family protein n=1 Tax=Klenkia soli TaxID=1052260 RepID=UPI000B88288F|nr:phosphatase PAP2 family protein [Klenkia soli]
MTSPSAAAAPARRGAAVIGTGRPPWWAVLLGVVVTVLVTVDLLARGALERMDLAVSEIVSDWGLRDSVAYWPVWVLTQAGGRVTILVVLAGLVGWIAWKRRSPLPVVRVLLALVLLSAVVYAFKYGTGRTAPAYPGSFFHRDGASYPSGHVANAVLMWGVARWQAVDFGLPDRAQRAFWVLSVIGPVVTGVAMVALDFHWVTDALVGAAVGVVLLGVVHALDAVVLSRFVRARGRRTAA